MSLAQGKPGLRSLHALQSGVARAGRGAWGERAAPSGRADGATVSRLLAAAAAARGLTSAPTPSILPAGPGARRQTWTDALSGPCRRGRSRMIVVDTSAIPLP